MGVNGASGSFDRVAKQSPSSADPPHSAHRSIHGTARSGGLYDVSVLLTHQAECTAETTSAPDFVDITSQLEDAIATSGIRAGQVTVFCPEDSCTILVNEFEQGLLADLRRTIEGLRSSWPRAVIGTRSVVLPAADGRLRLGTWQRVLLVELDGAATRSVHVQILGEA